MYTADADTVLQELTFKLLPATLVTPVDVHANPVQYANRFSAPTLVFAVFESSKLRL